MKKLLMILFFASILLVSCNNETSNESVSSESIPIESTPNESVQNESLPNESVDDVSTHVHDFSGELEFDENGHFVTCECGEVSRSEHIMEDVRIIKESTCTEEGVMETKCKDCGYSSEVAVSKKDHEYKDDFCTTCGSHKSIEYIKFEHLDDGWFVKLDYEDNLERYDLPITELYIPSYTDTGEKVVGVGDFSDLIQLKKVVLPEGIKYIGEIAFSYCTALEEVLFLGDKSSEITIKGAAFAGCSGLKKLEIPEKCYLLGGKNFYLCKKLKSLDTLIVGGDLGESVFEGCVSLKKVKFSDSVKSVGWQVFQDCYSLKEVDLGGITKISYEMFRACSALETIVIPDSVIEIEGKAFYGCEKLKSVVLSNKLKIIGYYTFAACISLESITLPKDLITLDRRFF